MLQLKADPWHSTEMALSRLPAFIQHAGQSLACANEYLSYCNPHPQVPQSSPLDGGSGLRRFPSAFALSRADVRGDFMRPMKAIYALAEKMSLSYNS